MSRERDRGSEVVTCVYSCAVGLIVGLASLLTV